MPHEQWWTYFASQRHCFVTNQFQCLRKRTDCINFCSFRTSTEISMNFDSFEQVLFFKTKTLFVVIIGCYLHNISYNHEINNVCFYIPRHRNVYWHTMTNSTMCSQPKSKFLVEGKNLIWMLVTVLFFWTD